MNPRINMRTLITFFFCLSLLYPFQIEAKAKNTIDLIMEVCDQEASAIKKKFCIETLKSNPSTATAKDSKALAETTVEMAKKQSTEASTLLKSTLTKSPASAISQCVKYFDDTIGMLSLRGLNDGTATLDIHYAYDNVGQCETALAKDNVHNEQISSTIQKWKDGFEVTLAAVSIAEKDNSDN